MKCIMRSIQRHRLADVVIAAQEMKPRNKSNTIEKKLNIWMVNFQFRMANAKFQGGSKKKVSLEPCCSATYQD